MSSAARDAQLASASAGVLYLVEARFSTGTYYFTNWTHNIEWMGQVWLGFGAVISVGAITEVEGIQYPAVDIGLSVSDPAMLALARGNVQTYRGKPVLIYMGVLDDELRLVGEPELEWVGRMDQVRIKTGDGEEDAAGVSMRCEMPGRDNRGPQTLRLNHAQQQARYPGDTGLSRVEALTGRPVAWLSKKFQHQD